MSHAKDILSTLRRGDRHEDCPKCGRLNDLFVNPNHCYNCSYEWGDD